MSNAMWGGAFASSPSQLMKKINSSIVFDHKLYKQDIAGSIAHAQMLAIQGIITENDNVKIKQGLLQILQEIELGNFTFSQDLEDIHMNIESRLLEIIGDSAKKLHTARSRNDQVATDCKLFVIEATQTVEQLLQQILTSLLKKAQNCVFDIMPAFTHLQIAQPVSIAHYLLARYIKSIT